MKPDHTTIKLLQQLASGQWVSGTELAQQLSLSREAVSKRMRKLSDWQLAVEKQAGRGYRLEQPLELLDQQSLGAALKDLIPADNVAVLASVDSTNGWLADRDSMRLCVAEHQSGGRGRRGRQWHSPFGQNLYLSVKQELPSWPEQLPALGLALGVALCEQLQQQFAIPMQLKWPNDLYLEGHKCGGMLIEQRGEAQGRCQLIIGLGLNVQMYAAQIDQNWTSLYKQGHKVSRQALLESLARVVLQETRALSNHSLSERLQTFSHFDVYAGCEVSIRGADQTHHGRADGIDDWGRLQLRTAQGLKTFSVGDVSLRAHS